MTAYKTTAITLLSTLAMLTGCPSDDTSGTGSGTETDPTVGETDPTTGVTMSTTGSETGPDPDTTDTETDSGTDTDTDTDTGADEGQVRVVHASPGAGPVDIWVQGLDTPVIEGLAYGETSDYLPVDADDYVFEVRVAGDGADVDPVFATDALTIAAGDSITAIAAGQVGGEGDAAFRVLPLADGFDDPADGAQARIVHAGSDAPAVDIDVGNDGKVELEGVAPYADSGEAGVALPAGEALQVGILAAGEPLTAFTTPELTAGEGIYIIATGLTSDLPRVDTGFSLLAVGPEGSIGFIRQNPRVYTLHAGSDAPTVDVCVDGTPLLEGVEYGAVGGIQVPPGVYGLDIHATGAESCAGEPAFEADTPDLAAGGQYLAMAAGELEAENGEPEFGVFFYEEGFALDNDPGDAVVGIIHGAAAADVNVGLVTDLGDATFTGENTLVTGLGFGEETARDIPVTEDSVLVGVGPATDMQPPYNVAANFTVATPDNARAWVIATGSLEPDADEQPLELKTIITGTTAWTVATSDAVLP